MLPGIALITGAGGTGSGIARAFVKSGCTRLLLTDINPTSLQSTVDSLQGLSDAELKVATHAGDISDAAFIESLFDKLQSEFGRIDYLVNCAGIGGNNARSDLTSIDAFDKINGVNYKGLWMCSRKALGMMKEQEIEVREGVDSIRGQRGSIVNIASQLGVVGREDAPVYCATKSAVIGLTRCDAVDYSPFQIRVNAVCPGIIDTPMTRPLNPDEKTFSLDKEIEMSAMKRKGTVDEVADVVCFLSSEKASFVQGAAWVVDGGYTIV